MAASIVAGDLTETANARSMHDPHDLDDIACRIEPIENRIAIAAQRPAKNMRLVLGSARERMIGANLDRMLDCKRNASRAIRASLLDIAKNFIDIAQSARRINE